MGLVDLSRVVPLLVCPRCRCAVAEGAEGLRCGSSSCALNAPGSFPFVERWPAVVDFDRSILERPGLLESGSGTHPGPSRWSIDRLPPRLRSLWKPRNRVAARNIEILLAACGPAPLILVVGGGTIGNGVEAIYRERGRVVAFDIQGTPHVQLIADAHQIPFADQSVDAVVVQAVLEHVLDPRRVVAEIHRILKPDGLVYAETPFLQPVHAGGYDFTRYTSSGHRYLFRRFEEIAAGPVDGPGAQILTSADHLIRGLLRSELAGKLARALFFWLRYLDRLIPTSFAMDNASAYYFLGRRSERELAPQEIVAYYRGAQGTRVSHRPATG